MNGHAGSAGDPYGTHSVLYGSRGRCGPDRDDVISRLDHKTIFYLTAHLDACLVRINDLDVIAVQRCLTRDEAIVRVADAAAKRVSSKKSEVRGGIP